MSKHNREMARSPLKFEYFVPKGSKHGGKGRMNLIPRSAREAELGCPLSKDTAPVGPTQNQERDKQVQRNPNS